MLLAFLTLASMDTAHSPGNSKKSSAVLTMFCQSGLILHHLRMKPVLWIPALCAITLALSSCGNLGNVGGGSGRGTQQAGVGPFDENGNYIEAWADDPSKWRTSGNKPSPHELKSDEIPVIAKRDQPPQNSIPLAPGSESKRKTTVSKTTIAGRSKSTASSSTKTARTTSSRSGSKSTSTATRSKASVKSTPTIKPKSSSAATKPRAKASTTATKSKTTSTTAAKTKSTKRVVKKVE